MSLNFATRSPLVLRIFLCFLLPSIFSTNALQTYNQPTSQAWLKYWSVISVALVLEFIQEQISCFQGKPYLSSTCNLLKLSFLLWCLAPINYNGSEVIYTNVLSPLCLLSKQAAVNLRNMCEICAEYFPILSALVLEYVRSMSEYVVSASVIAFEWVKVASIKGANYAVSMSYIYGEYLKNNLLEWGEYVRSIAIIYAEYVLNMTGVYGEYVKNHSLVAVKYVSNMSSVAVVYVKNVSSEGGEYVVKIANNVAPAAVEHLRQAAGTAGAALTTAGSAVSTAVDAVIEYISDFSPIVLTKLNDFGGEFVRLLNIFLETINDTSRQIVAAVSKSFKDINLAEVASAITETLKKIGQDFGALVAIIYNKVVGGLKEISTSGEEYRKMSGIFNWLVDTKEERPRRLFSNWFKTVVM